MTTLAPKLPWSHAYAGGFPRIGGQSLVSDADAQDYLNRVKAADGGVGVEVGVAQAIDAFVKGCKADSAGYAGDPTRTNWDALQACCIMAGARTISGALVPLKGTAPTAQGGWTASDYSRGGSTPGLQGNGSTLYLDTNRANNADGQNDNHLAVYTTQGATTADSMLLSDGGLRSLYQQGVRLIGRANSSTLTIVDPGNVAGLMGVTRSQSGSQTARAAGTSVTGAAASQTPSSLSLLVFRNQTGAGLYSDARLSFYSIGSACDLAALDARTSHLMNSIRFTLLTGLNPGDYDPATLAYLLAAYTAGGSLS